MATYAELFQLTLDATLVQRMTIAVAVAADLVRAESADVPYHSERAAWAKRAMLNPDGMARQMLILALAQNKTLAASVIASVDDAALQTATNAAVALLL